MISSGFPLLGIETRFWPSVPTQAGRAAHTIAGFLLPLPLSGDGWRSCPSFLSDLLEAGAAAPSLGLDERLPRLGLSFFPLDFSFLGELRLPPREALELRLLEPLEEEDRPED